MNGLVCEMVISWPGQDGMVEQEDCGKPATRVVNEVRFEALVAENDPDLIEKVEVITDVGTEN